MVLPLGVIRASSNRQVLVEQRDGRTLSGILVSSDAWMNLYLSDVKVMDPSGHNFSHVNKCYVRGNGIKSICVTEDAVASSLSSGHQ